jgi:hypothetical protein
VKVERDMIEVNSDELAQTHGGNGGTCIPFPFLAALQIIGLCAGINLS